MIVFDIETGPLPDDELKSRVPAFNPPPPPGEFDKSSVKIPDSWGPEAAQKKIEKARQQHIKKIEDYEVETRGAQAEWWAGVLDEAALSAQTGKILAIGYLSADRDPPVEILDIDDESAMLGRFWQQYRKCTAGNRTLVGHNIFGFDVPFLVQRSWQLRVDVPSVFERNYYIETRTFIDTMRLWSCGRREYIGLGALAEILGVGRKPEDIDGSAFAGLLKTDREQAEAYLANDLKMTIRVATAMGVV